MECDEDNKHSKKDSNSTQYEIVYNKLLPFATEINQDSEILLQEIKINLQKSVMLRELRPGCLVWSEKLLKFISLYGLKFSKEDHIEYVNLFYQLVLIPDLDASRITLFTNILNTLLRKKHLLHPTELTLPWKPLYQLMQRLLDSSYEDVGLLHVPSYLSSVLRNLISNCRFYFSLESQEEMLSEWRPLLCPFDVSMLKGISLIETFLPTTHYHLSNQPVNPAWLEELMELWKLSHNQSSWEADLVQLFSRVSAFNTGLLNWESIMPLMFSRILHSFGLPVGYKKNKGLSGHKYDLGSVVTWIVSCLGGQSSCQDHLSGLFRAIESYYYPSNVGSWNEKLNDFLRRLSTSFAKRLRIERLNKKHWHSKIMDSVKLTESDVTRFVQSLLPVSLLAMFSRHGSYDASVTFHQLAQISPQLVIPPLLDRLQNALNNVTEPLQLISVLQCLVSVSRPLVSGGAPFPEGPANVLPLLIACLPAIDPNDVRKTMVAFQLIASIATLVPLVDCSPALSVRSDLAEEEANLCSATAGFEDFVLQFIDRCFVLVENCSHEHTRMDRARTTENMNRDESLLEIGLSSTVAALLMQCSPYIFDSALSKIQYLVGQRTFEPNVAGRFVARMCGSVAKVNSEKALKVLLPPALRFLRGALTDDILSDETLDDSILFRLLLLSELVRCPGYSIAPFAEDLSKVLYQALNLRSKEGYTLAGSILNNVLKSLTTVYPCEHSKGAPICDADFKDCLPIREWGKPFDIDNSKIHWHIPNEDEKRLAGEIIKTSIEDSLKILESHGNGNEPVRREDIQRALSHLLNCILGAGAVLPPFQDTPVDYLETGVVLPLSGKFFLTRNQEWEIEVRNSTDVRRIISSAVSVVVNNMMTSSTEDTTALFTAIAIYQRLLSYHGVLKENYEVHQKNYHIFKKILGSNLIGRKSDVRAVVVDRVHLQYELGVLENGYSTLLTESSRGALTDLFKLAVSRYSEVRRKAQGVLNFMIRQNPFAVRHCITQDILATLNPQASHEEVKGCLYLLTQHTHKQRPLLATLDWDAMKNLWIALANISPSEKASIIQLIQEVPRLINRSIETMSMKLKFSEESVSAAASLHSFRLSKEDEERFVIKELERGTKNEKTYIELVETLADLMKSDSLHWRMYCLVFNMLCFQLRPDVPATPKVVGLFVQNLIHETIAIRKVAIKGVSAILKQQKRKHPKIIINPQEIASKFSRPYSSNNSSCAPGEGWYNSWLQFSKDLSPKSAEEWNESRFIHKTHIGFYAWPKELEIYAPDQQQPSLDRPLSDYSEEERVVFEFFSQPSNVEKLISFLALEERKGKDKFNATRFSLFKGLFRNFGDVFLDVFVPHLERLVCEPHEAAQRCAAEIISGLVRGSKLWPYAKVERMWSILSPLLLKGFTHITVESIADWGTAFATISESRDPNRMHWLFNTILQEPVITEQGSFIDTNRVYLIQGVVAQQEWRVSHILSHLLQTLRPYLDHPYQSMRSRLGSMLTNIFLYDIALPGGHRTLSPHVEDFVNEILPKLKPLKEIKANDAVANGQDHKDSEEEQPRSVSLLKTVCQWLCGMWTRSYGCALPAQLKLLPYLFGSESNDSDKELSQECTYALSLICTTVMEPEALLVAIQAVWDIAQEGGWRAKVAALEFLQALIFNNLFNMINLKDIVDKITLLVLTLLRDNRVEVRDKAADVLGGLLHCEFWNSDGKKSLLAQFQNQVKNAAIPKRSAGVAKRSAGDPVLERHAGVLGLCAFVAASPYDVPEYLPEVIVGLGDFLHDPPPIPTTIKKTLSNFKRTHQDNWASHKEKFTDDQLVVLTDLLLSPNYYV